MKNPLRKYLEKRKSELLPQISEGELAVFQSCFNLLEKQMLENFDDVTPEAVRKIELLECLLFSFIDHALDFDLLEVMDEAISRPRYKSVVH